jgi:hypothetical protein
VNNLHFVWVLARYLNGIKLSKAELDLVAEDIAKWRNRLYDVSWYMRNLIESIARQANEKDNCTGKYWEGRIKSQALLDDAALAATTTPTHLEPFVGGEHQDNPIGLNFSLPDYLELKDWVGQAIRVDKTGVIPSELAPILERLNIAPEVWLDSVKPMVKTTTQSLEQGKV